MEYKRSGIHLMIIGGTNPLDEYKIFAVSAFDADNPFFRLVFFCKLNYPQQGNMGD